MTETVKELFLRNLGSSVKFSVIVILLLALTRPVMKRYTAGFRYYSWLAVMIIFLIPFGSIGISYKVDVTPVVSNIQSETAAVRGWYEEKMPKQTVTKTVPVLQRDGQTVKESTAKVKYETPADMTVIFGIIWLLGAAAFFALHMGRYFSFRRTVRRISSRLNDEKTAQILKEEKERLKITADVPVRVFPAAGTPMLIGILRPFILLPESGFSPGELSLIFRHELIHLKRRDIIYQLIMLIFISLNWYNPFAYVMARSVEIDGETACDEKVIV